MTVGATSSSPAASGRRAYRSSTVAKQETSEVKATRKKTKISTADLIADAKEAKEKNGVPEKLVAYLESGNHEALDESLRLSNLLGELFSTKNESATKQVFGNGHYQYALANSFAEDDNERELTRSLIRFVTAEDDKSREQEFQENLAQLFMSNGHMLPESDLIDTAEKNRGLRPLVAAAKSLGLYSLVNKTIVDVNKGENPSFIEKDIYEGLIQFDMKSIESKFDPDSGSIMKNGEVLVPSMRVDRDDIEAMNLNPDDPNCPIKDGQSINWYNFIKDARALGMGKDKQKFVNHIQNTLAIANALIRKRIADAEATLGTAASREVERYQNYQTNLLNIFKEGYNTCPKAMVKLVATAFAEAPAGTKTVRQVLSGKAEEFIQNSTIDEQVQLIVDDAKTNTEPSFQLIKDATNTELAGTAFIQSAINGENDVTFGTFDSSSGKVTFTGNNRLTVNADANNETKFTFTQVSKKYKDLVKNISTKFRKDFGNTFFGKSGASVENIPEFTTDNKKTIQEIAENYRKQGAAKVYADDTQALNDIRDKLSERLLKGVTEGVYADIDNSQKTQILEDLVFGLVKTSVKNGNELDKKEKEALRVHLGSEINALKVAIGARDLSGVPGANDTEKEKNVKESLTKLIDAIRTTEFKANKKTGNLEAKSSTKLDPNAVLIRDKAIFDDMIRNGKAAGFLAKITADPNTKDDFSSIDFKAIDGLIESLDSLKTTLLDNHSPDGVEKLKELKDKRLEATSLVAALYATKDEISSEAVRNSTKLAAFLELVKESKLTDQEKDQVVSKLFSKRIGAVDEGSKTAERTALVTSLESVIDPAGTYNDLFQIQVNDSPTNIVDLQGINITRAQAAKDIGSLVTERANAKAVERVGALISSFAPDGKLGDMSNGLEALQSHTSDMLDKGVDSIEDIQESLGKMPAEAKRAYARYKERSEIDDLTRDKASELEPHNATSILEDLVSFCKGLMQTFRGVRQSKDDEIADSGQGVQPENKPGPKPELETAETKES